MLFDTHCHLDAREFVVDRDEVMAAARAGGVSTLVVPAVEVGNFAAVRDCCRRYSGCVPAYGIHPLYVGTASENDLAQLNHWMDQEAEGPNPAIAIGEIGLDFYSPGNDTKRQEFFFVEQLRIAKIRNLPVLLHTRRAVDQVLKCLRRSGVRGGIAHAFNGSRQQADAFITLGFRIGFGGAMTYPGSTRIRALATNLPLDAIVLETDSPDIPPIWLRNKTAAPRNTPDQLPRIAEVLAELRRQPVEEVILATTANAELCLRSST